MANFTAVIGPIVGVVVGGALVMFTQRYMHSVTTATKRRDHLREKLETLAKLVFEHSQWVEREVNRVVLDIPNPDIRDYIADANAIQELYFYHQLGHEIFVLEKTYSKHLNYVVEFYNNVALMQTGLSPAQKGALWDHAKYCEDFRQPYLNARLAFMTKCREIREGYDEEESVQFSGRTIIRRLKSAVGPRLITARSYCIKVATGGRRRASGRRPASGSSTPG